MPNPHFDISIAQRSKGKSAVAGAAYQSGNRLFSEYDQKYKDYQRKQGIVYTEIMLPENAPRKYTDRETLWNSAEEAEKQWNSQLARRFVLALPREIPSEYYPDMIREYCGEHFVSKGMCCDFAIHDPHPPGHNPHCHVMLTMRAMDEQGKWLPKSRKVYDLDENGERIKLPNGNWKSHKENTVDWNEQYHGEEWRHGWELVQNRYLEKTGSPERVDLRSYEKQGLDIIPTVHMGAAVTHMERRGILTNIGNLNRDIKAANRLMDAIRKIISNLRDWLTELFEIKQKVFSEVQAKKSSPGLTDLLNAYIAIRKEELKDWREYLKTENPKDYLEDVPRAMVYLKSQNILTLEDLGNTLSSLDERAKKIRSDMKKASGRMREISGIQNAVSDCKTHEAVHEKYLKIGWKNRQAAFAEAHKDELDSYNKAFLYLKKMGVDSTVNLDELQSEYDSLGAVHTKCSKELSSVRAELKPIKEVQNWVNRVLAADETESGKKTRTDTEHIRQIHERHREHQKTETERKNNKER